MEGLLAAAASAVASMVVSGVAWLIADGKSKSRLVFMEEKLKAYEQTITAHQDRVSSLEVRSARSEQDRADIHRMVDRLDNSKASKEVVDGFRVEISNLRVDMDKRFDRLERLIEKSFTADRGKARGNACVE